MKDLLKTEKAGKDSWYFVNSPVIADYSGQNLGIYTADYIQRKAASEERASEGRGFYLYDNSGDLAYFSKTLKEVMSYVTNANAATRGNYNG